MDKLFDEQFTSQRNDPITIYQKVLECVALHPSITLEQIIEYLKVQKTKFEDSVLKQHKERTRNQNARLSDFMTQPNRERYDVSEENIIKVLGSYMLFPDDSLDQFLGASEPEEMRSQYYNFISHLLIRAIEDKTHKKRYELTLFGVILILVIILSNHRNLRKVYFNQFLNRNGVDNYYSMVVSNYKDKLPLIFGKWKVLTDAFFDTDRVMMNFESVFYKKDRDKLISSSMNLGGIKELYENLEQITTYRYSKLTQIYNTGESMLVDKEIDPDRAEPIIKALSDIELRLATADLKRFSQYISEQNFTNISESNIVTSIENSFANEVSFLFYIALAREAEYLPEIKDASIFPSQLSKFVAHGTERSNLVTSRRILRSILEDDNEIRERFSIWCKDSISYENQIKDCMLNLQREMGLSLDN